MCTRRPSRFQRINSFAAKPQRHHQELQIEPVRLEPQKQIDAEDDRKRREAQSVDRRAATSRAACRMHTRKAIAARMKGAKGVDRRPIPAPIQQHRALRAGLHVVLLPQDHLQRERPPFAPRPDSSIAFHTHSSGRRAQKRVSTLGFWRPERGRQGRRDRSRERQRQKQPPRFKQIRPACSVGLPHFHFTHCVLVRPRSAGQASPIRG